MTAHDEDVRQVLVQAFREFVDEVLDDPAWIAGEAPEFIARLRKTAAWLGLDFEVLLGTHHSKYEVERLRALERRKL